MWKFHGHQAHDLLKTVYVKETAISKLNAGFRLRFLGCTYLILTAAYASGSHVGSMMNWTQRCSVPLLDCTSRDASAPQIQQHQLHILEDGAVTCLAGSFGSKLNHFIGSTLEVPVREEFAFYKIHYCPALYFLATGCFPLQLRRNLPPPYRLSLYVWH